MKLTAQIFCVSPHSTKYKLIVETIFSQFALEL